MKQKIISRYLNNNKFIITVLLFIVTLVCFSGCTRSSPVNDPASPINDPSFLVPLSTFKISVTGPSGLFYNSKRGTLFTVSDKQPMLYELDTNGRLIGSIPISTTDQEGISFSRNYDTIYIVEETSKLLSVFTLQGKKISSFSLGIPTTSKNGPEGIAVNSNNSHIYVINSKLPGILIEFSSDVKEIKRTNISFSTDLSDICFDKKLNCLWLLSHDDKKLFKMNLDGTMVKSWSFYIVQAEGIAFSDDDKLYIVSDSDAMFYIFDKPS